MTELARPACDGHVILPVMQTIEHIYGYLFDPARGSREHFLARWLFLRALGLIYFSAFYALLFQVPWSDSDREAYFPPPNTCRP